MKHRRTCLSKSIASFKRLVKLATDQISWSWNAASLMLGSDTSRSTLGAIETKPSSSSLLRKIAISTRWHPLHSYLLPQMPNDCWISSGTVPPGRRYAACTAQPPWDFFPVWCVKLAKSSWGYRGLTPSKNKTRLASHRTLKSGESQ